MIKTLICIHYPVIKKAIKCIILLRDQIANQPGLAHWVAEGGNFAQRLEEAGLRVWQIYSAIGFSGFVIGKRVNQLADGKGA
jgi:hypothetical protein